MSNFKFLFGEYASKYKYIGMYLNEFLDFSATVANASSRTLGGIIAKIKELKNVTLKVFELLSAQCITVVCAQ